MELMVNNTINSTQLVFRFRISDEDMNVSQCNVIWSEMMEIWMRVCLWVTKWLLFFFLPITVRCAFVSTGLAVLLLNDASQTYKPVSEEVGAGIMSRCPLESRHPSRFHDTRRRSTGLRGEEKGGEERRGEKEWAELGGRRQLQHIKSISLFVNEAGNEWWQSISEQSALLSMKELQSVTLNVGKGNGFSCKMKFCFG